MKKLFLPIVLVLLCSVASAQQIRSINTRVYIDGEGDALIRQSWDVTVVSGTEWYIPIENLGDMEIRGLKVREDGREFENVGAWDSGMGILEKAGHCGIIDKGKAGVELCWGVGAMGDHKWDIEYVALGLVQSLKDYDAFNYMFVNPDLTAAPQHVEVSFLKLDGGPFNTDSTRFWFFGTEGFSELLDDGTVLFEADNLLRDDSVICMMRFEKGVFAPHVSRDIKFEKMQKKAFKGSSYSTGGLSLEAIIDIFFELLIVLVAVFSVLWMVMLKIKDNILKATGKQWKASYFGANKVEGWEREAPFEGSIPIAAALLKDGSRLSFKDDNVGNVIGAYFLKWIEEKTVTPVLAADGHYDLIFPEVQPEFTSNAERNLYLKAFEACGDNHILEKGEFDSWSKKHYRSLTGWPDTLLYEGRTKLAAFKGNNKKTESAKLLMFKNFLNDFTLSKVREVPEVTLWGEYLVFAQLFGIADKVAEGFSKRYPEKFEDFSKTYGLDPYAMRTVIRTWDANSRLAYSRAASELSSENSSSSSSSGSSGGFGGYSSRGGGGGFSGGGHGGGSR